jgi:fucose permease
MRLGHWNPILWTGYGIYVVAAGVQTTFTRNTSHAYIVGILFLEGFGIGWTMQTALVAAQAIAPPEDRAVITGIRNLFRFVGGSFGLAIASAIMNNVIHSQITKAGLPESITGEITGVQFNIPAGLTSEQVEILRDAEMEGVRGVFWFLFGVSVLTLLMSLPVEDHGLPKDPSKKRTDEEASDGVEKIEGNEDEKIEENESVEGENTDTPDETRDISVTWEGVDTQKQRKECI